MLAPGDRTHTVASADDAPGPLIGSGRAAHIHDLGHGRVLRRDHHGASAETQGRLLGHLRTHGFPVPEVFDARGADLVMERIEGASMLDRLPREPWKLRRYARLLADLVGRLQQVPLPSFSLPALDTAGDVVVHGDVHPGNVMMSSRGPVVIDRSTACIGPRGADAAMTWVLATTAEVDPGPASWFAKVARGRFARIFVDHAGREQARALLPEAARHRIADPGIRPGEIPRIRELLRREGLELPKEA